MLAAMVGGCKKGTSPGGADLSSPQSTLRSYAAAMKSGNSQAAKDAVTGLDPEVVDVMTQSVASRNRLAEAAVAKFGDDGKSLAPQNRTGPADMDKWLADAEIKESGDTATVTPKDHPEQKLSLKRFNGDWKIDLSSMPGVSMLSSMMPMMKKMNQANDELAADIQAGKYATLADAKRASAQKMMSTFLDGSGKGFPQLPKTDPTETGK